MHIALYSGIKGARSAFGKKLSQGFSRFRSMSSMSSTGSRGSEDEPSCVFVFHRHGDRAPSSPMMSDSGDRERDAAFWRDKIYSHSPGTPIDAHSALTGTYNDVGNPPYGFLTKLGYESMVEVGQQLNRIYGGKRWDVKIFSTNYLRTVTSVKALYEGLSRNAVESLDPPPFSSNLSSAESDVAGGGSGSGSGSGGVVVREKGVCTLNAYDKDPEGSRAVIRSVIKNHSEFKKREEDALRLVAEPLMNFFGGFEGEGRKVDWIHLVDHFVCRAAHGMMCTQLAPKSSNGLSEEAAADERRMELLGGKAMEYLCWR